MSDESYRVAAVIRRSTVLRRSNRTVAQKTRIRCFQMTGRTSKMRSKTCYPSDSFSSEPSVILWTTFQLHPRRYETILNPPVSNANVSVSAFGVFREMLVLWDRPHDWELGSTRGIKSAQKRNCDRCTFNLNTRRTKWESCQSFARSCCILRNVSSW